MTEVGRAIAALRRGEIVGIPTDTVYGIAADPFAEAAVARLFAAKKRPAVKPIPILAADIEDLGVLARIDDAVQDGARLHWPGPLTLIVPRSASAPVWIGDPARNSVAVRIPDHPIALAILETYGPLAVTSANQSGFEALADADSARAEFGDAVDVYLRGKALRGVPSTVVDVTGAEPRVLRQGPVEWRSI